MIKVHISGSFKNTQAFAGRVRSRLPLKQLAKYGPIGVAALQAATPVESNESATSWYYEIVDKSGYYAIHWYNSHMEDMIPIVALIQYGHGTRGGSYVQGTDFINPALAPIFNQIAADMWKEVTK